MVERSWFGAQAARRTNAAVTLGRPDPGGTLAVASAGTLLTLVAFTLPLTTLASTGADLGAGPGTLTWILSAMSLGAAAGLLSSGALGDDYGRRRTFLAGVLVLAGASVLGALAPNALVLTVARFVEGLGGAAVLACSLGLIGHAFPAGPARTRATGVWGPRSAPALRSDRSWLPGLVPSGHGGCPTWPRRWLRRPSPWPVGRCSPSRGRHSRARSMRPARCCSGWGWRP